MSQRMAENLLTDRRVNAVVGWIFLAFLGVVAAGSVLGGDLTWAVFVTGVLVLCLLPPIAFRNPEAMLPWEVVVLAALSTLARAVATVDLTSDLTTYLSVAALALIVAVELDLFTDVRLTVGFAIAFVLLATLATAGGWALFRWSVDLLVGTEFLLESGVEEDVIHDELMIEFVYAAVSGLLAGVVFELYFRRRDAGTDRLPEEAIEA
jgi:hypothetical protein